MNERNPLVGIVMGSANDWPVMCKAAEVLHEFSVAYETRVLSAHRTPDYFMEYVAAVQGRGLRLMIGGAGGAAHLPGIMAAKTLLPVLGVPIDATPLKALILYTPLCKCRAVFPSPLLPSGMPVRPTPLCLPLPF